VSGKLCSSGQRFVWRLHGGLQRNLHGRRALRAQSPDSNPDDHADADDYADPDQHTNPDQHADPDDHADAHRNRHQHTCGERLLSVQRFLRRSDRRHVRRVRCGVWGDLRRRGSLRLSHANADDCGNQHPASDRDGDTDSDAAPNADGDSGADEFTHLYADSDQSPHADANSDRDTDTKRDAGCYPHPHVDSFVDDGSNAHCNGDEHGNADAHKRSNGDTDTNANRVCRRLYYGSAGNGRRCT